MDHQTSKQLASALISTKNYVLEPHALPLNGFHEWADGHNCDAAYRVRSPSGIILWILLIEWNKKTPGKFYVIVFSESKQRPICELHKVILHNEKPLLQWNYSPKKHDGENKARHDNFTRLYGAEKAVIALPVNSKDADKFLEELFRLAYSRLKADALEENNEFVLQSDINQILARNDLAQTTKETMIQARLGQGRYRKKMLKLWGGKCAVTGLQCEALLVASHAKPWAISTDEERLDVNNGLPLSANLDKLFDRKLITFDPSDGKMIVSNSINRLDQEALGIPSNLIKKLEPKQSKFFKYHFDEFIAQQQADKE